MPKMPPGAQADERVNQGLLTAIFLLVPGLSDIYTNKLSKRSASIMWVAWLKRSFIDLQVS